MSEKIKVPKGLAGVIVDETKVSKVMPEINSLVYRGYPVQELAELCSFEEVAYLLVHDDLPNQSQLNDFTAKEKKYRSISEHLQQVIALFPSDAHPMDKVRTGISYFGMEDKLIWENDPQTNRDKFMLLLAKIPTIIAYAYRHQKGQAVIPPSDTLSFSENFFYMCFGEVPSKEVVKAFDVSMILYAEHSFNASTFTTRVISSTLSDLYSAVVGGVGALKGPLHGGANEQVMHTMLEIGDPVNAKQWMLDALAQKRKIMGFGHRVYTNGDSRVPTMKKYMQQMAASKKGEKWVEMYEILEQTMIEQKGIYPNLDFPTGPAYYMMGFEIEWFTPLFVMSRIAGWSAHIIEQIADNRLIRPLSEYTGMAQRSPKPVASR
ncbi:MAG: citrate synthase [Chitinophagaceae bacterium]|nr:citrate synthase [Chitinophagaceae bacterium]